MPLLVRAMTPRSRSHSRGPTRGDGSSMPDFLPRPSTYAIDLSVERTFDRLGGHSIGAWSVAGR